jgi:hypothetical protein
MGDNWEELSELADAVIIVGPGKQELPVHSIELAKLSKVRVLLQTLISRDGARSHSSPLEVGARLEQ